MHAQARTLNRMRQNSWTGKETFRLVLLVFALLMMTGRLFFEVLSLPFRASYFNGQVFALCLALRCYSVFYASACWRRKIIFLRTNVVGKTESSENWTPAVSGKRQTSDATERNEQCKRKIDAISQGTEKNRII